MRPNSRMRIARNGFTSRDMGVSVPVELVYNGTGYVTFGGVNQTAPGQRQEQIGPAYKELASLAYKSDGVVFACMLVRMLLFSARLVTFAL